MRDVAETVVISLLILGLIFLCEWLLNKNGKQEPPPPDRIIWGEHCFAKYSHGNGAQPWLVQQYDIDWGFYLTNEADAIELMRRIDERGGER